LGKSVLGGVVGPTVIITLFGEVFTGCLEAVDVFDADFFESVFGADFAVVFSFATGFVATVFTVFRAATVVVFDFGSGLGVVFLAVVVVFFGLGAGFLGAGFLGAGLGFDFVFGELKSSLLLPKS